RATTACAARALSGASPAGKGAPGTQSQTTSAPLYYPAARPALVYCQCAGFSRRPIPLGERTPGTVEHFDEPAPTRSVSGDSERLRANIEHAATLIADGREDDAIPLLRAAIEAGYPGADARVLLGEVLLRRGDPDGRTLLQVATIDATWGARAQAALRAADGHAEER